jgi:hypothetical protein
MNLETPPKQALVFGASGITGWAIARMSLSYPTTTTFSRVIGLANRPLSLAESYLPTDPRLSLQSGVDLSGDERSIYHSLSQIDGIGETTHVYFTGSKQCRVSNSANSAVQHISIMAGERIRAINAIKQMSICFSTHSK